MTGIRGRSGSLLGGALAALMIGHWAVLMATHGSAGAAGANADGHGATWMLWSLTAVLTTIALSGLAMRHIRLIASTRAARGHEARARQLRHVGFYLHRVARLWLGLLVGVSLLYVLQENVEYLRFDGSLSGLDVLRLGELVVALPLLPLATLLVAGIIALAGWCHCILASRRAGLPRRVRGRPHQARYLVASDVTLVSAILARRASGRAPPSRAHLLA